jgi:transposase
LAVLARTGRRDLIGARARGTHHLSRVGVESTSSYGAGLARYLRLVGVTVVEIDRPDRRARRARGKSDPIDAYAAARHALSGAHTVVPKAGDGIVEPMARRSLLKDRLRSRSSQRESRLRHGPA